MSDTFSWTDFLDLAEELALRTSDEAALRTAISRAYYAAYCTAATHVLTQRLDLKASDLNHKLVWRLFQDRSSRLVWSIFDNGMAVLSMRVEADYAVRMKGHTLAVQVRDSLRRTREILRALDMVVNRQSQERRPSETSAEPRKDDA